MFNKHFYSLVAACTLAAAILFAAFAPPDDGQNKTKAPAQTVAKTIPSAVDCSCTFSSGSCTNCTCSGGFATGCAVVANAREKGKPAPLSVFMSANQLRQALKYQRFLLSLDSPEATAAAVQVSQLIEAIQDGKTADYQEVAEQYRQTHVKFPKYGGYVD
jgi:hypothetical protein